MSTPGGASASTRCGASLAIYAGMGEWDAHACAGYQGHEGRGTPHYDADGFAWQTPEKPDPEAS